MQERISQILTPPSKVKKKKNSQIRIHQITQKAHENQTDPYPDRNRTKSRNIPRHTLVLPCPPQPEYPNHKHRRTNHRSRQSLLCRWKSTPFHDKLCVFARGVPINDRTNRGANSNADKGETGLGNCEMVADDEYNWEGLENCTRKGELIEEKIKEEEGETYVHRVNRKQSKCKR